MATQSQPQLGKLLTGAEGRDAIHIAIIPVVAGEVLHRAERVNLHSRNEKGQWIVKKATEGIGIIDPFLETIAVAGDCVYLFLNPYTITSLRHVWTHPAFSSKVENE